MIIFSENPKPFTIHRKSLLASDLKSSISQKLLEFLGNYTDEVLAEYITVLVCNGKDQYQARKDLEAFLGEKSGEFVSWLWDLLLKCAHPSGSDVNLPDMGKASVTSPPVSDAADKESRRNKSSNLSNHGTKEARGSLRKDEKMYHHSTALLNKATTEKIDPQKCLLQIPGRVSATKNSNDGLAYKTPETRGSTVVSDCREQSILHMEKLTKIGNMKCNELNNEQVHNNSRASTSEHPCIRQALAADVSERSISPRSKGPVSKQIETSRGSVWDRLGQPSNNTPAKSESVDAFCVMNTMKGDKSHTQPALKPFMPNDDFNLNIPGRVYRPGYRHGNNNNPMENKELHHGKNTTCKPNLANNIGRKRHFGEVISGPTSGSDSLVGEGNRDLRDKEISQDVEAKHPKATTKEVLDVKQRLSQMEMEMSKLRSKQSEMEREGKSSLLPQFGTSKHPKDDSEGDIESRTVTVTNVHFAATKEAIYSHFVKCGPVVNIVILMNKATGQPKGAAYICFAHKESVAKALALSGTTFFSRTIRVFKKPEAAAVTSGSAPLAGEAFKSPISRINRKVTPYRAYNSSSHLQWRRDSVPSPSEAVAPKKKSVEDDKALSTLTGEANSSSVDLTQIPEQSL